MQNRIFVVIIIDQLGWDDRVHFEALTPLLGKPKRRVSGVFPSLTESVHASLSVGTLPGQHGVIGSETYCDKEGLRWICVDDNLFIHGLCCGTPLVHELTEKGIQTLVLSGKEKVAQIIDPRPEYPVALSGNRVTYADDRRVGSFKIRTHPATLEYLLFKDVRIPEGPKDPRLDISILECAEIFLNADGVLLSRDLFLFLGLPALDVIGHGWGHENPLFRRFSKMLEGRISKLIRIIRERFDEALFFVSGDHGVRKIDTTVCQSSEDPGLLIINQSGRSWVVPLPLEDLLVIPDKKGDLPIIFDGGTVRFWTLSGREEHLIAYLQNELKDIFSEVFRVDELERMAEHRRLSRHIHWGKVIGMARRNVGLLKKQWGNSVAEHGTDHLEDRTVPVWGRDCSLDLRGEVFRFLGLN